MTTALRSMPIFIVELPQKTRIPSDPHAKRQEFSNARGLAADFFSDGHFDQAAFAGHRQDHQIALLLQPIAKRELNIDDLTRQTDIRNALVQAYKLGRGL